MKIKTLTLMRKQTTCESEEVSRIITMDIRCIILKIQFRTTTGMVNMIDHQTENKETGKIEMGIDIIVVVYLFTEVE